MEGTVIKLHFSSVPKFPFFISSLTAPPCNLSHTALINLPTSWDSCNNLQLFLHFSMVQHLKIFARS